MSLHDQFLCTYRPTVYISFHALITESAEQILESLKCGSYNNTKDWYTRAQHKYDLPVRLHYQKSPRIEDVVVTVTDEWQIAG